MKEYYNEFPDPGNEVLSNPEEAIEEQDNNLKPQDPKLKLILTQMVLCCLALLAAFGFKFIGGDVYSAVKEKYTSLFESNVSVGEVLDAMTRKLNISGGENLASSDTSSDTTAVNAVVSADAASSDSASAASDSAKDENNFLPINSVPVESTTSSEEEAKAVGLSLDASASNGGINEMTVPVTGTITSGFGYRTHPIYGTYLFHSGVDIGTESGTPISAALSGTVETAEYSSSYGYYIILSHSDSVKTVYAHCSELLKSVGDTVSKGETIALVGSTGVSTGPHLHFEVRTGGICINPLWILKL